MNGAVTGWGPDNGRWNLDFADGVTAHALGCGDVVLRRPHRLVHPLDGRLLEPRRPRPRLELPHREPRVVGRGALQRHRAVPLAVGRLVRHRRDDAVLDLRPVEPRVSRCSRARRSSPGPRLAVPPGRHEALLDRQHERGNDSNQVEVQYLDVTQPGRAQPSSARRPSATAGRGRPAASTFKAFTIDDTQGLAVVPFSGWDHERLAVHERRPAHSVHADRHHEQRDGVHERAGSSAASS